MAATTQISAKHKNADLNGVTAGRKFYKRHSFLQRVRRQRATKREGFKEKETSSSDDWYTRPKRFSQNYEELVSGNTDISEERQNFVNQKW